MAEKAVNAVSVNKGRQWYLCAEHTEKKLEEKKDAGDSAVVKITGDTWCEMCVAENKSESAANDTSKPELGKEGEENGIKI